MLDIRTESDVPIYRQIADGLRLAVASGRLAPGDEVPSVRAMALKLRINPNTVARAYRDLESAGFLETRRGRGTFVAGGAKKDARAARRSVVEARARELIEAARQAGMNDDDIVETVRKSLGKKVTR